MLVANNSFLYGFWQNCVPLAKRLKRCFVTCLFMKRGNLAAELIAPCGANCGICVAFFGYTLNGKRRKSVCSGCRSRVSRCAFIKKHCDRVATGQLQYCFECVRFPCERLKVLDSRYRSKYEMSMIENLSNIQNKGIELFLKDERERWKCPNCGGIICVHNKKCYTCDKI